MNEKYEILLSKAEKILKSNMYTSGEFLWGKHRMISPGRSHFKGVWNWDSAFHAIGMLDFDTEIAKEQITGFLQFQKEDGLLPDVIWETGEIVDGFSKPPVMAWAALKVYERTKDIDFLKQVYPKLVLNEKFWTEQRFYNGLFHYDARRDGDNKLYLKHVSYESGWDNSPRWDKKPQELWAIDLNCFMVMTYQSLCAMAEALGEDGTQWSDKEKELIANIENHLWNEKMQSYTDYDFKNHNFSDVLSPASFMPLFAGFAPEDRAKLMNDIATEHFLPGMPTAAYDSPDFSDDYWRGPTWLNVAYFAAKGLKDYGYTETAETVKQTILNWVSEDGDKIHENYNPVTGEGLCCGRFSWSCVFVREFIKNF